MKHLVNILEGLFDIDKNVTDEHEMEKNMFEDYNSELWNYIVPMYGNSKMPESIWERYEKNIDLDKEIIWIPDMPIHLNTKINNPLVNKYTLVCNEFCIGNRVGGSPHPDPVADGGGFKEIKCAAVQIDGFAEKVDGFKFNIEDDRIARQKVVINWASDLDYLDADFNFSDPTKALLLRETRSFPELKNVKSNTTMISLYDCSFFDCDDIKKSFDKFFGGGKIEANGIVKNKSTRNIVAMINNPRKYGSIDPNQLIPVGKLSDMLDLGGFKNLKRVIMRSNNVRFTFVKSKDMDLINRQARFIRINNMKKYKDWNLDQMVDEVLKCQTKDGWVLIYEPENY